jgi:glycosyltransferase involved in cell wall biosynthesis
VSQKNQEHWEHFFSRFGEYPTESSIALSDILDIEKNVTIASESSIRIVEGKVLIDVTDVCNFDTATGIQRVVRNLISQLKEQKREFLLVAWAKNENYMRTLSQNEVKVAYGEDLSLGHAPELGLMDPDEYEVLLPRECLVFVPELAGQAGRIQRLSALATISSNSLVTMAYDAVPIVLPETTAPGMPGAFTFHTQIWSRSKKVLAISDSTAREVSALLSGKASSGANVPKVVPIPLPVCSPSEQMSEKPIWPHRSDPTVLVVGTHEPRKNHLRILFAAEELWRKGKKFHLVFIGSRGWRAEEFWEKFESLKYSGFAIEQYHGVRDPELCRAYSDACCLLFPSIHEGFGLPITEAIAIGIPIITSNVGSMRDLAQDFGLHSVDPTSIDELYLALENAVSGVLPLPNKVTSTSGYSYSWNEYSERVWSQLDMDFK